jgi:formylglycine-generating enzyme required for sulfatase activity
MNTLSRRRSRGVLALSVLLGCASGGALHAQPVPPPSYGFDFVTVGNVGNPAYISPPLQSYANGRGSVGYEYRIGRLEVTTAQWMEFINTFASLPQYEFFGDPGLDWGAGPDALYGGPGRRYRLNSSIPNAAMVPVESLSWRECAQYCNWLHNGKSSDPTSLITGAYDTTTWGGGGTFSNPFTDGATHLAGARYWIPTLDEWLKAAHYDPNRFGEAQGGWWQFSHMSDVAPIYGLPGIGESSASPDVGINRWQIPLGSYPDVQSAYGLLDLSGGASEWLEEWLSPDRPNLRYVEGRAAFDSLYPTPDFNADDIDQPAEAYRPTLGLAGLRIASAVPAPSTLTLLISFTMFAFRRRSR